MHVPAAPLSPGRMTTSSISSSAGKELASKLAARRTWEEPRQDAVVRGARPVPPPVPPLAGEGRRGETTSRRPPPPLLDKQQRTTVPPTPTRPAPPSPAGKNMPRVVTADFTNRASSSGATQRRPVPPPLPHATSNTNMRAGTTTTTTMRRPPPPPSPSHTNVPTQTPPQRPPPPRPSSLRENSTRPPIPRERSYRKSASYRGLTTINTSSPAPSSGGSIPVRDSSSSSPAPPPVPSSPGNKAKLSPEVLLAASRSQATKQQQQQPPAAPPRIRHVFGMKDRDVVLEHLREPLTAFYNRVNPDKIASIDAILFFFGKHGPTLGATRLNDALKQQYGMTLQTPLAELRRSDSSGIVTPQESSPIPAAAAAPDTAQPPPSPPPPPPDKSAPVLARAITSFESEHQRDLRFSCGDLIEVTQMNDEWCVGITGDGRMGLFPRDTVEILSDDTNNIRVEPTEVVDEYPAELREDDKNMTHWFKSLLEVVSSELKHVTLLYQCKQCFIVPLSNRIGKKRIEDIFPVWDTMISLHEKLLEDLASVLLSVNTIEQVFQELAVGSITRKASYNDPDLFFAAPEGKNRALLNDVAIRLDKLEEAYTMRMETGVSFEEPRHREERCRMLCEWAKMQSKIMDRFPAFLKLANPFFQAYNQSRKTIEGFQGDDAKYVSELEKNPGLRNLILRDFLILPVQRVMRYPLLYKEVLKRTPEDQAAVRQIILETHDKYQVIVGHINDVLGQESAERLLELRKCLRPIEEVQRLGLNEPSCRLMLETELSVVSVGTDVAVAPETKSMEDISLQLVDKPRGSIRGLLFSDQLMLVTLYKNLLAQTRLTIVHSIKLVDWHDIKLEPLGDEEFVLTLSHSPSSPARGSSVIWHFNVGLARRKDWITFFQETLRLVENARKRKTQAVNEEAKREEQRQKRRSMELNSNNPPLVRTTHPPKPPPRNGAVLAKRRSFNLNGGGGGGGDDVAVMAANDRIVEELKNRLSTVHRNLV